MDILIPPLFTTLRVNESKDVDFVKEELEIKLKKAYSTNGIEPVAPLIFEHSQLKSTLIIPTTVQDPSDCYKHVVVDNPCGMAVLRGADVFAPGVLSVPTGIQSGDKVAVFADVSKSCLRGMTSFNGIKLFLGNGVMLMSRNDIFKSANDVKGICIEMESPVFQSLCLNDVLPSKIFVQNLPSIVVGHVLAPLAGDTVLDMCAAPGGKTSHILSLMHGKGQLVAVDRSQHKVEKIEHNASKLGTMANILKVFQADSRKLSPDEPDPQCKHEQFKAATFDKILLDAPCSALGQRPRCYLRDDSDKKRSNNIQSYPPLQKQLFSTAVKLLKPGGTLVYSTCTTTHDENEGLVEWALSSHSCLQLAKQEPKIGGPGRDEASNLSSSQLQLLQYFPLPTSVECTQSDNVYKFDNARYKDATKNVFNSICDFEKLANQDTIGFFIARFIKA